MIFDDMLKVAKERRATKVYDPTKDIDKETMDKIFEFTHTAPHSLGLDLTRIIAFDKNSEHRQHILPLTMHNAAKMEQAPYFALLVTRKDNFVSMDSMGFVHARREVVKYTAESAGQEFVDDPSIWMPMLIDGDWANNGGNKEEWLARQAYIQLGYMMLGAKALGVDTTPMEGFEGKPLDAYLLEQGLIDKTERTTLMVAFGHGEGVEGAYVGPKQLRRNHDRYITYK